MKAKKGFRYLLSMLLVLCMILSMSLSVFATGLSGGAGGNTDVEADKQGVLQVRVGFKTKDTNEIIEIMSGTGFLINSEYLITCHHVLDFNQTTKIEGKRYTIYEIIEAGWGLNKKQVDERKTIQISVYRDMKIQAKLVQESATTDLAILKLEQPLQNKTFLRISDGPVATTAPCYTLGFPGLIDATGDINTYTSDDVTITGGLVNKMHQVDTVSYIAFSANTTEGGSGGPLVNYAGDVIGVTRMAVSANGFDKDFMYAVDVKELRAMLDPLGIEYTVSTGSPQGGGGNDPGGNGNGGEGNTTEKPIVEEEKPLDWGALDDAVDKAGALNKDDYEKPYSDNFEKALTEARDLKKSGDATQDDIKRATQNLIDKQDEMEQHKKSGLPIPLPAIIAIAAAVIILIVVAIMMSGRKGKGGGGYDVPPADIPPYTPPTPPVPPMGGGYSADPYAGGGAGGTTVLGGGASDTTVLGGGSNATTVLSGGTSYGTLTRSKTGERVTISRDQFKIGRERSRVDYCISDNTAVGRLHAIIVSRGGSTFVVDQNSTNCTFVNSVRAAANQEVRINNGDKIAFADEEFTFNAF